MQRRGQAIPVRLPLLLALLLTCSDILEGDGALDLLAGEDGLIVPVDKDADVARVFGGRHGVVAALFTGRRSGAGRAASLAV